MFVCVARQAWTGLPNMWVTSVSYVVVSYTLSLLHPTQATSQSRLPILALIFGFSGSPLFCDAEQWTPLYPICLVYY